MSIISFFTNLWNSIFHKYKELDEDVKQKALVASQVVENIKIALESPMVDILTGLIPGDADDEIKNKLRECLPIILDDLKLVQDNNNSIDEIINQALQQIKFSSDDAKATIYLGIASMIVRSLTDGKFTISEAQDIAKATYKLFLNGR